ncbi:glycogen debranching protein GlgX [bacterium]|nr:glycogen debranching protein GlgX [bacterium]
MRFYWAAVAAAVLIMADCSETAWGRAAAVSQTARQGQTSPLGAHCDGRGVNFAVYSQNAQAVTLCLFDGSGQETARYALNRSDEGIWSGYIEGIGAGQRYGYRADGPYDPKQGWYFNACKLLLDPYAKQVSGPAEFSPILYPFKPGTDTGSLDQRDSAPYVPKAVVAEDSYDWEGDKRPDIPWESTVLYEVHVKGFSQLNPEVSEAWRGTYAGLGAPASVAHLKRLGVTAVELLPVYLCLGEAHLAQNGLSNYWGYNPAGLFVPDPRFSAGPDSRAEFRQMVKNLHAAGIEVILDVVYNHSAEQGAAGPVISWKGLDSRTYYKLNQEKEYSFQDYTGCGNSFDLRQRAVLQMVLDSLRYWAEEMHVDGFRFDLASVLGRTGPSDEFSPDAPFFKALAADPVLSRVKLIAEPWDCSAGGYQIGNYPEPWSEWNGEWRDTLRRFWRGDRGQIGALARKMVGSPDRYARRSPQASINFVTCHDGFTLNDIVSYNIKHNENNGEGNRDGSNDNFSWNCGTEGAAGCAAITELRQRQMRNMLMSIALSQGVPMFLGGDEMCRTQRGNNNAYCQDNEVSYLPWQRDKQTAEQEEFLSRLLRIRREIPALHRSSFANLADGHTGWYDRHGQRLREGDLDLVGDNCLGIWMSDPQSSRQWLLAMCSESRSMEFTLPAGNWIVQASSDCKPEISECRLHMIPYSCYLLSSL